ncbi:MAG: glycosyltransferase, partial [Candidatus Omnitrophica bacterium]|nr:glycosyltransferase [Candidatus Omnitrophota bacterium]
ETDWARGFCFLVTRRVLDKIGGLDEAFAPAYFDDWDYSIRAIKACFRCACALGAFVWHYKNVTYGLEFSNDSLRWKGKIFYRRWGAPIKILLLDDQNGRMPVSDFACFIRELLNGQDRVTFVSARADHVFSEHTNMRYCRVPQFWFRPYIILRLLDNLRYHKLKRYDMIITSKKMLDSLRSISIIWNSFPQRFYTYDGKFGNLLAEVAKLKQKKAQSFL